MSPERRWPVSILSYAQDPAEIVDLYDFHNVYTVVTCSIFYSFFPSVLTSR